MLHWLLLRLFKARFPCAIWRRRWREVYCDRDVCVTIAFVARCCSPPVGDLIIGNGDNVYNGAHVVARTIGEFSTQTGTVLRLRPLRRWELAGRFADSQIGRLR